MTIARFDDQRSWSQFLEDLCAGPVTVVGWWQSLGWQNPDICKGLQALLPAIVGSEHTLASMWR